MKTTNNNQSHKSCTDISLASKQQGMTLISWLVVIVFILFQVVMAMNIIPVYMSDSSVKSIMKELPDDITAQEATSKELKTIIMKRLRVNNVSAVTSADVVIKKGRGEHIVTIDYEPRGPLIGNLEFIVNFTHEAVVPMRR